MMCRFKIIQMIIFWHVPDVDIIQPKKTKELGLHLNNKVNFNEHVSKLSSQSASNYKLYLD